VSSEQIRQIYDCLFKRYGHQHWWPGESRFEIIIGAILTQNTSWGNVEKAIRNLKTAGLLDPDSLHKLEIGNLAQLIRPAGYYNIKAARLMHFIDWLFERHGGKLENIDKISTATLREELLSTKGIGPETADSIALYAFDRPVFVVDAYTARVAVRHFLVEPCPDYETLQYAFTSALEPDVHLYNEYHALIVRVAKDYCRKQALCPGCPLEHLPHDPNPIC
jgi:endonuclease-3 related protein